MRIKNTIRKQLNKNAPKKRDICNSIHIVKVDNYDRTSMQDLQEACKRQHVRRLQIHRLDKKLEGYSGGLGQQQRSRERSWHNSTRKIRDKSEISLFLSYTFALRKKNPWEKERRKMMNMKMNLKEFLKPTKGKIVLFAVMFLIYAIFWLLPGLIQYPYLLMLKSQIDTLTEGSNATDFEPFVSISLLSPTELFIVAIAEILSIYLLSCIIIAVKNKIKKK